MFGCKKTTIALATLLCLSSGAFAKNLDEIIDLKAQAEKERLAIDAGIKTPSLKLRNDAESYSKIELENTFTLISLSRFGYSFRAKIETQNGVITVNNRQPIVSAPWMIKTTFDGGVIITDGKKERRMILMENDTNGYQGSPAAVNNTMPPMPQMQAPSPRQQYQSPTPIVPR